MNFATKAGAKVIKVSLLANIFINKFKKYLLIYSNYLTFKY